MNGFNINALQRKKRKSTADNAYSLKLYNFSAETIPTACCDNIRLITIYF